MSSAPVFASLRPFPDQSIKHLELVQGVISRMAQNSFFVKGWSIAMVSAILAVSSQKLSLPVSLLALFPAASFWYLDAYYLRQERLYRRLYVFIAEHHGSPDGRAFSLDTSSFAAEEGLLSALTSGTILGTHFLVGLVIFACVTAGIINLFR